MPLIDLSQLRTGDVILETGERLIAQATEGGKYGHASVALGRLVKIEAGKCNGVEICLFDLEFWQKDETTLMGFLINGDAVVRRLLKPPEVADIVSRALGEAGRGYATADEIGKLRDLNNYAHRFMSLWRANSVAPADGQLERRFCSEIAAEILGLQTTMISPNALALLNGLLTVSDAVVPEDGWKKMDICPIRFDIQAAMCGGVGTPIVDVWKMLRSAVARLRKVSSAECIKQISTDLEGELDQLITRSVKKIEKIRLLETKIFPAPPASKLD